MSSYVVTGASRGIGLEFIRQLSQDPNNVVIGLVRNVDTAKELAEIRHTRNNIHIIQADIADYKALETAAAEVKIITGGRLDNLINNAAYVQDERKEYALNEYPAGEENLLEEDLLASFKINVVGVVHTINAFLPLLTGASPSKPAKLITLSTGMADTKLVLAGDIKSHASYAISKAALNMVVAKYAAKFRADNIIFLAISPGLVDTAVKPPTGAELEVIIDMVQRFKKAYPGWDGKPISPEVSVTMMLDVIGKLEQKDSGAFVSHYGNQEWL